MAIRLLSHLFMRNPVAESRKRVWADSFAIPSGARPGHRPNSRRPSAAQCRGPSAASGDGHTREIPQPDHSPPWPDRVLGGDRTPRRGPADRPPDRAGKSASGSSAPAALRRRGRPLALRRALSTRIRRMASAAAAKKWPRLFQLLRRRRPGAGRPRGPGRWLRGSGRAVPAASFCAAELAEFVVNQRQKLLRRRRVAGLDLGKDASEVRHKATTFRSKSEKSEFFGSQRLPHSIKPPATRSREAIRSAPEKTVKDCAKSLSLEQTFEKPRFSGRLSVRFRAARCVPDLQPVSAADEPLAVGTKGKGGYSSCVCFKRERFLPAGRVPNLQHSVGTAAGNPLPVRAVGQAQYHTVVPFQARDFACRWLRPKP